LAGYFFDTSALVKLYHSEQGTSAVERIVNSPDNAVRISRLTVIELASACAIKVRTKSIEENDADAFLRQFRSDILMGKYELFSIAESEFVVADRLIGRYAFDLPLRSLDALQLAVALELRKQELVNFFVAADRALCEIAAFEGLSVINPEQA
jgi:uncharacterized protein